MARLFRGSCAACSYSPPVIPDQWLAVRLRSGSVEVLPHPGEERRLAELGFTWDEAQREHRLLRRVAGVCVDCSATNDLDADDKRIPTPPASWSEILVIAGGLVTVAAAVAGAFSVNAGVGLGWRLLMLPGIVAMALMVYGSSIWAVGDLIAKYWRPRLAALPASSVPCGHCASGRVYPVELLVERPLVCPACSVRAYSVRIFGIS